MAWWIFGHIIDIMVGLFVLAIILFVYVFWDDIKKLKKKREDNDEEQRKL